MKDIYLYTYYNNSIFILFKLFHFLHKRHESRLFAPNKHEQSTKPKTTNGYHFKVSPSTKHTSFSFFFLIVRIFEKIIGKISFKFQGTKKMSKKSQRKFKCQKSLKELIIPQIKLLIPHIKVVNPIKRVVNGAFLISEFPLGLI